MKNLYVCEKCGKTFDNWDDAYNCENSHQDVSMLYNFNLDAGNQTMPLQFWEDGEQLPSVIIMQHARVDQNGDYIMRTLPDGTKTYDWIPVIYKRSVGVTLPNGMKKVDYYDAMKRKQDMEHPAPETETEADSEQEDN